MKAERTETQLGPVSAAATGVTFGSRHLHRLPDAWSGFMGERSSHPREKCES
jgi:hypothetical protein